MEPVWRTPRGNEVRLTVRDDTNDWSVCQSVIAEDEYKIPHPLSGTALDIGAHIGAASVAMLADNPDLRVVAVEPIPANVELLRKNTERYGERVVILEAAAGTNPKVAWNWRGSDIALVHRFIGNQHFGPGTPHDTITVPTVTLSQLVASYGPISFMKIDAEGAEDTFLDDPALDSVERMSGEFHNGPRVEIRHEKPKRDPGEKPVNRKRRVTKKAAAK